MAIVTKFTQPTSPLTGSLSGRIQIDEAQGRLTVFDGTNNRMVIGLYNGRVIIAISKPGQDVFAALDA